MIKFDDKFFMDEIRDGFYVGGGMKRIWAAQMEVLMEIDRICKKFDIPYFAASGTLLGAVRHNGHIPWDDDVDIIMFRDDYMRFVNIARKELSFPFMSLDIYHDENDGQPAGRIVNGFGINLNRWFLERFHGCPHGVGIDIFIYDNMPETESEFNIIKKMVKRIFQIRALLDIAEKGEIEKLLLGVERDYKVTLHREKNIGNQLLRIIDGLFALCNGNGSEEVENMPFTENIDYYHAGYKREWYRKSIELPFENITIPAPIGFHEALEQEFGKNYLMPVKYSHDVCRTAHRIMNTVGKDIRNVNERMECLEKLLEN